MSDAGFSGRVRPKAMLHVQHLLGSGHLHRMARIASALDDAGFAVTLVSGGEPVSGLHYSAAEFVQLPPVRTLDASFTTLVDTNGNPVDAIWRAARAAMLLDVFARTAPDLLLIEMFPFGRRKFDFELTPLLDRAVRRTPRPLIAVSVRDIVMPSSKPGRTELALSRLAAYFDCVLVHGDAAFLPFTQFYPTAQLITDKLFHTGYVGPASNARSPGGTNEIIVSAGGGAVGQKLLHAALAARAHSQLASNHVWRLLVGANAPAGSLAVLNANAPSGVIIEPARPDFPALLHGCACSVSQAGYNSVVEVLQAGAKAVLVPFADGNELEQSMRADAFEKAGRATVVSEKHLSPENLARAVDAALRQQLPALKIDLNGATATAAFLRHKVLHA